MQTIWPYLTDLHAALPAPAAYTALIVVTVNAVRRIERPPSIRSGKFDG